jgi:hypothetical protein
MTDPILPAVPPNGDVASPQRIYMDRARAQAIRDLEKPPRRPLQAVIGMVAAIVVVTVILLGFSAFLASVQRALHVMEVQDKAETDQKKAEAGKKREREPMPAYVVPPAPAQDDPPPR